MTLRERVMSLVDSGGSLAMADMGSLLGGDLEAAEAESLELCQMVYRGGILLRSGDVRRYGTAFYVLSARGLAELLKLKGLREESLESLCDIIGKSNGVRLDGTTANLFLHPVFRQDKRVQEDILKMVEHWEKIGADSWTVGQQDIHRVTVLSPQNWYRAVSTMESESVRKVATVDDYLTPEHGRVLSPDQWAELADESEVLLNNPPFMTNPDRARIAARGSAQVREVIFSTIARTR